MNVQKMRDTWYWFAAQMADPPPTPHMTVNPAMGPLGLYGDGWIRLGPFATRRLMLHECAHCYEDRPAFHASPAAADFLKVAGCLSWGLRARERFAVALAGMLIAPERWAGRPVGAVLWCLLARR